MTEYHGEFASLKGEFCDPEFCQMEDDEAHALYSHVRAEKPQVALEMGTALGGGSTYFIASAMLANGVGGLYTVEIDHGAYHTACARYEIGAKHLLPHVIFLCGDSRVMLPQLVADRPPDFVMLDGAAGTAREEISLLHDALAPGATVAMHDCFSNKTAGALDAFKAGARWQPRWTVGDSTTRRVRISTKGEVTFGSATGLSCWGIS